jgi:aspartyl/asparaginyl-tRNA synthetase
MQAVAKIEANLLKGVRKYFDDNDFIEIVVPHLTRATAASRKHIYHVHSGELVGAAEREF